MQSPVKKATLVASIFLSLTLGHVAHAQAATSLGDVSNLVTFANTTSTGSFDDFYNFTVDPNSGSVFVALSFTYNGTGADVASLSLYTGTLVAADPHDLIAQSSPTTDATVGYFQLHTAAGTSGLLSPGAYSLEVKGVGTGVSAYSGTFALAPVPEPKSYALLLAGLGMMGTIAQRRRKSRE